MKFSVLIAVYMYASNDIDDLMFSRDLDANIIHFYMQHLEKGKGLKSIFFQSEAWVKIYFLIYGLL